MEAATSTWACVGRLCCDRAALTSLAQTERREANKAEENEEGEEWGWEMPARKEKREEVKGKKEKRQERERGDADEGGKAEGANMEVEGWWGKAQRGWVKP